MKKILLFLIVIVICSSCHCVRGTITTYTLDGKILKQYNGIIIDNSIFKDYGLRFYYWHTDQDVIIAKNVPYIIECHDY